MLGNVQEAVRKDLMRAFGVLQSKLQVITLQARFFPVDTLAHVMRYVIVLNIMMVEERKEYLELS